MAELTRRAFIGQAGAAAVTASAMASEDLGQDQVFERLKKLEGRRLRLSNDGRTWTDCRLTRVEVIGDSPFAGARRPFAALLVAPRDADLNQDVYVIHDGLTEQFRHLVVPVDRTEEGLILELNFS